MAEPTPGQVQPWYLRNINQALALDSATGNVYLRTGFTGNIVIDGNVNIPGEVTVVTTEDDPLITHTHIFTPNDQEVSNTNPFAVQVISGNITVDAVTGNIAGVTANVTVVDGGGSLTVDGTVSIAGTANVSVQGNISGITDPVTVTGTVNAAITSGTISTTFATTQLDAFGRLRVSEPFTLFDSRNRYVDGGLFSSDLSGSGTVTYNSNGSNFTLSVTGNGDEVIRQSKTVQLYQPGKSLLIMNTFAMQTPIADLRQRVGYFTVGNGVYFEADGEDLYLVIRSSVSGSVVNTRIAQANWNSDTLNGNGASGITLDPSKTQIFWMDIEWLGVGSVRTGFVINGVFYLAHTFNHANILTDVYMTTACLNCRYEITSTGAAGTMLQICSTVISEGGYDPSISLDYVSSGTTFTRITSADTLTSLASIRLNPATIDSVVIPAQVDLLTDDVRYGEFRLIEGASNVPASWSNSVSTVTQYQAHSNVITDGRTMFAGLLTSRTVTEIDDQVQRRLQLKREANAEPITLTLAVAWTSGNTDLLWKLGWQELSG